MKCKSLFCLALPANLFLMILLAIPGIALAAPASPGTDTVLIDHFDDSTIASFSSMPLTYLDGPAGYGKSVDFSAGNWVKYDVPGWYEWTREYDATGKQGSIELWVYPLTYDISLVNFNWRDSLSSPADGHILHLGINADGKLRAETWTAIESPSLRPLPTGNTTIPLNQWTHIAFTWGDTGTRLYVNDILDASTPDNLYPALKTTFYVYVPYWGKDGLGYIDELHILKTQLGDTSQPQTTAPIPADLLVLIGAGILIVIAGAGLVIWLNRRRK